MANICSATKRLFTDSGKIRTETPIRLWEYRTDLLSVYTGVHSRILPNTALKERKKSDWLFKNSEPLHNERLFANLKND